MTTRLILPLLLSSGVSFAGEPSAAHTVEYRHLYFESMARHMKSSAMIVKGEVARPGDLAGHAQSIASLATALPDLFPAGTGPDAFPKTEALPVIWEKPDEFKAKAATFAERAQAFAAAATAGDADAAKGAFFALGKSCGDCHDTFRKDNK